MSPVAVAWVALLVTGLPAPPATTPDTRFPELERDAERRPRGLVYLCADAAAARALPPEREPRVRLSIGAAGGAASLEQGDTETRIELVPDSRDVVDDRGLTLDGAASIVFDDASVVDWTRALYPRGRRTVLASTIWRRHSAGTDVRAVGRSAAALGAACPVEPDELAPLDWRASNPRSAGESVTFWSLGFFPWALVDVASSPGASFERFFERAWRDRLRLGVWLPPGSALVVDAAGGRATARGPSPVLWLDLKRARRSREWILGGRLSLLAAGGRWEQDQRTVLAPAPGSVRRTAADEIREIELGAALGEEGLATLLDQFGGTHPPRTLVLFDREVRLRITVDAETELWTSPAGSPFASRLHVDLHAIYTQASVR